MIGRVAIVAFAIGLAACAGLEPAGRNANRSPSAPAPRAAQPTPAPPPPSQTLAPAAAPAPTTPPARQPTQPPVAAPQVTVPTPAPARAQSDDDDVVVPGQVQTQVPPPAGDPRTNEQRRADIRAWDQCLMQVQSAFDADPMNPQLTSPEEYCSTSLGMAERTAVPIARQQPRRR